MSNQANDKKDDAKKTEEVSKLKVDTETYGKLSDKELDKVSGGARARGATLNPTSTDGCCGS